MDGSIVAAQQISAISADAPTGALWTTCFDLHRATLSKRYHRRYINWTRSMMYCRILTLTAEMYTDQTHFKKRRGVKDPWWQKINLVPDGFQPPHRIVKLIHLDIY
jgi:hypothetical protein